MVRDFFTSTRARDSCDETNTAVYSGRNQSITNRQRWPVRTTGDRAPAEVPDGGLTHSRIEQNVIGFPVAVDVGGASEHPAQR